MPDVTIEDAQREFVSPMELRQQIYALTSDETNRVNEQKLIDNLYDLLSSQIDVRLAWRNRYGESKAKKPKGKGINYDKFLEAYDKFLETKQNYFQIIKDYRDSKRT